LESRLDGSATAVTSLSAVVCLAIVNCPVQVPSLSFQHRRDTVLFFATTVNSRFQASTAMSIPSLFWDVTQHMLAVGYRRFGTTYRPNINPLNAKLYPICHLLALLGALHIFHVSGLRVKVSSGPRSPTETLAAWRTSTAETSMLPVAKIVTRVVLERMHVEQWWNDANRWQHKYSARYSFQCQFVHHKPYTYSPGTSSSVRAVTRATVCPTRQLKEDVPEASRAISHKNKTIIVRLLPKSETVPKHAQDCSLLKICNPKCCKHFRSCLHFSLPCDTSSLLCTEERPSFLSVAYRSSSPPDIPEDCYLMNVGRCGCTDS